jgi:hypothetical protein
MHRIPIGPTGAAIDKPMIMPWKKKLRSMKSGADKTLSRSRNWYHHGCFWEKDSWLRIATGNKQMIQ